MHFLLNVVNNMRGDVDFKKHSHAETKWVGPKKKKKTFKKGG